MHKWPLDLTVDSTNTHQIKTGNSGVKLPFFQLWISIIKVISKTKTIKDNTEVYNL